MAENRLCMAVEKTELAEIRSGIFSDAEFVFFSDACKLLAGDELFSPDTRKALGDAVAIFEQGVLQNNANYSDAGVDSAPDQDAARLRRALNSVKHLLLSQTGRDQADWDFTAGDGRLDPVKRQIFPGMLVYMEDIRSPFNVGAMFRTAESFGVEKIILSPFCADPCHRRSLRTAMGCVGIVPWERRELFSADDQTQPVSGNGEPPCPVFALETGGIPLAEFPFPRQGLLIAGSEELGVSPRALAAADASLGRVSIPCYGAKASLNVSVAFGIAMQAWAEVLAKDITQRR